MKLDAKEAQQRVKKGTSKSAQTLTWIGYIGQEEAESFTFWYSLRTHPERLDEETKELITTIAPNRIKLYDAVMNP